MLSKDLKILFHIQRLLVGLGLEDRIAIETSDAVSN